MLRHGILTYVVLLVQLIGHAAVGQSNPGLTCGRNRQAGSEWIGQAVNSITTSRASRWMDASEYATIHTQSAFAANTPTDRPPSAAGSMTPPQENACSCSRKTVQRAAVQALPPPLPQVWRFRVQKHPYCTHTTDIAVPPAPQPAVPSSFTFSRYDGKVFTSMSTLLTITAYSGTIAFPTCVHQCLHRLHSERLLGRVLLHTPMQMRQLR